VKLIAYMESGGTDGEHFRCAGIPAWAVRGIFTFYLSLNLFAK
jgi:hypothetical protein